MNSLESNEVAINLKLFKLFRFYHIFYPYSEKLCNFNVYHLAWYIINCVIGGIIIYGLLGHFTEMEDDIDIIFYIQILFCYLLYSLSLLKIITFLYKANDIWDLLSVTRINFLTSTQCQAHIGILHKHRSKSIQITNVISGFGIMTTLEWILFPLVLWLLPKTNANGSNQRFENIFNFRFPVTISEYNNNYFIFYIMESSIAVFMLYVYVVIDVFFISVCYVIIAQYEIIKRAYESVNCEQSPKNNNENKNNCNLNDCYDDLISILRDQQKHYAKLKLFYSTYKLIIVSTVVINSGSIIILTYASVVIFISSETIPIFSVAKLISAFAYMFFVLFFLCYLMERVNNKIESVQLGMYSCNWTAMSIKTKKLLLLSMRMHNANKLMIKTTPNKIINLQLFNSVIFDSIL
nr:odorant receptor 38 [Myzus persicae]